MPKHVLRRASLLMPLRSVLALAAVACSSASGSAADGGPATLADAAMNGGDTGSASEAGPASSDAGSSTVGDAGRDGSTSSDAAGGPDSGGASDAAAGHATATAVSVGVDSACALTAGGGVQCWGHNYAGQLGNNSTTSSSAPVQVTGLTNGVTSVSVGSDAACAFNAGGGLQCWGSNSAGQLGNASTTTCPNQGPCSLVPAPFTALTGGVTAASVGGQFACVLTAGGGVQCWGSNFAGGLGNNSAATSSSVPVQVTGLKSGVIAVSAGEGGAACALTAGGGVQCWGEYQYYGKQSSGVPVPITGLTSGVTTVSTGQGTVSSFACAVTAGGGVQCWGDNTSGELGNGSTAMSSVPVSVAGLTSGVTSVSAGGRFACALTAGGGVQCWGDNTWGELGNGSTTNSSAPVQVTGLTSGVTSVSVGEFFACALTAGGGVQCWGDNQYGQLGNNGATRCPNGYPCSLTPVSVTGF